MLLEQKKSWTNKGSISNLLQTFEWFILPWWKSIYQPKFQCRELYSRKPLVRCEWIVRVGPPLHHVMRLSLCCWSWRAAPCDRFFLLHNMPVCLQCWHNSDTRCVWLAMSHRTLAQFKTWHTWMMLFIVATRSNWASPGAPEQQTCLNFVLPLSFLTIDSVCLMLNLLIKWSFFITFR